LTKDEFALLVERLWRAGVKHCTLTDGEPLLNRESIAKCEVATATFPTVWVVTNGTLEFPDLNVLYIASLDGNREIHDQIRGADAYDRMRQNLKSSPNDRIVAISTVNTLNYSILPEIVRCAEDLGMLGIIFNWHTPHHMNDPLWLNYPLRNQCIDEISKLKETRPEFTLNSFAELELMRTPMWTKNCPNWFVVSYDATGRVKKPCILGERAICERCGCHVYPSLLATYSFDGSSPLKLQGCGSAFKADTLAGD
jgi:hypothetical protein